mgnify:CR=1 FL=1
MTLDNLTVETLREYLHEDEDAEMESQAEANKKTMLMQGVLAAAIQYAISYTGRTKEELCDFEDVPLAVLMLAADMYEVRQFTMNGIQVNPVAAQILGAHCRNLV